MGLRHLVCVEEVLPIVGLELPLAVWWDCDYFTNASPLYWPPKALEIALSSTVGLRRLHLRPDNLEDLAILELP